MREGDLTPDEPYLPEDEEITDIVRSGSKKTTEERMLEAPAWKQPKVHAAGTTLPRDVNFESQLADIDAKLDRGEGLSEKDADYMQYRALSRLLRSKRPSMVAKAVSLLQAARVKKILVVDGKEIEKPDDHGLALPGGPG